MTDFVVVGHGNSPVGRGWGSKIDGVSGVVIRMWNWHWQSLLDWGERYDYGFYEVSPVEMARFWKHNVQKPLLGWVASELYEYKHEHPEHDNIYWVDPKRWENEAINQLQGRGVGKRLKLTRGVRAACWIMEYMQPGQRLVLVGFDNVVARVGLTPEDGFPEAYRGCAAMFPFRDYKGGTRRYGSHDYGVEGPLLERIAERHGVVLKHAQEIW